MQGWLVKLQLESQLTDLQLEGWLAYLCLVTPLVYLSCRVSSSTQLLLPLLPCS